MAIKLYTATKYVSAGELVKAENVSDPSLQSLTIDWGESSPVVYSSNPPNPITFTYNTADTKTISITGYDGTDYVQQTFNNFFKVVTFDTYDPEIIRIFETTKLELPWGCPLIAPNEWVVKNNINDVFIKFYENLDYLERLSSIYTKPPTEYIGWLGSLSGEQATWHTFTENLSTELLSNTIVISQPLLDAPIIPNIFFIDNIQDIKCYDNLIWYTSKNGPHNTINAIKDTYSNMSVLSGLDEKSPQEYFGSIGALDFDSQGNLFVIDNLYNEIAVYNYDKEQVKLNYLFKLGGPESLILKTQFLKLNDIHIESFGDNKDNLLIVDTGNICIKRFTNTGTWLLTIRHSDIIGTTLENGFISVTTDRLGNIHALTFYNVYVFSSAGEFLFKYDIRNSSNQPPLKIISNYNENGFVYIVLTSSVLKFTDAGIFAGNVTENLVNLPNNTFTSAVQDSKNNLYISGNNIIYKYVDLVQIIRVKTPTTLSWPISSVLIDKNEFIQDWVYNKNFARLWDNMEIFRRSIYDKFEAHEIQPGISALNTNSATLSDQLYFQYGKEDIIIGINEFVTTDVINRVIGKLCSNQEVIKILLTEKSPAVIESLFTFCWSWAETSSLGKNPTTWDDTKCDELTGGDLPTEWNAAHSQCCST